MWVIHVYFYDIYNCNNYCILFVFRDGDWYALNGQTKLRLLTAFLPSLFPSGTYIVNLVLNLITMQEGKLIVLSIS